MHDQLQSRTRKHVAQLLVRKAKADRLRKHASVQESQDEWDLVKYQYSDVKELVRDLLWHRDDVKVIGPTEVKELLMASLHSVQVRHD
jgi:predicted DNA-binding transcriptional regulator YafY